MHLTRAGLAAAPLAAALAVFPALAAEPPRLSREAESAFRGVDEVAERLTRARAAVAALERGESTRGGPASWGGVLERAQAAAATVRRLDPPAAAEPPEPVPAEQLRACATRAAALARVDRAARALAAEGQRLAELRAFLKERLAQAQRAEEARHALVEAPRGNLDQDRLGALFPWSWSDLERPLATALSAYQADARRWLERVERLQAEGRGRSATLDAQAAEWGRARDCALAGRWVGSRTVEGAVSGLALTLVAGPEGWGGTLSLGGADLEVKGASLKGEAAEVTVAGGRARLSGTLSRDDRTFTGRLSTPEDGPGSFTLRRR